MSITSLSAGSGPAALGLAGILVYLSGNTGLGILLLFACFGLSFFWALRFK